MIIIESNNIFGERVNIYLNELMSCSKKFIYISPIQSIYNERSKTNSNFRKLSERIFYSKDNFDKYIFNELEGDGGYLPSVDMYFILKKLVENYFDFDTKLLNTYKTICYQLFELYKTLIFHNINYIRQEDLESVKSNYPTYCFYIFDIFNKFQNILHGIEDCVNSSNEKSIIYKIENPVIVLSIKNNKNKNFSNFINKKQQKIKQILLSVDEIYLDGFISFTDVDKYIIDQANKLGKEIIFITRNIQNHPNKEFLISKVYSCENNSNYKLINLDDKDYHPPKFIKLIQDNFYSGKISKDLDLINNSNLNFVEGFLNKYEEAKYITKKVSDIVKKNKNINNEDYNKIKEFIENEIVIISSADGSINSNLLEEQFSKSGVFIKKNKDIKELKMKIKSETIKGIYYDIDEFLKENILFQDNSPLNISEKLILWKKGFYSISLKNKTQSIISSPIFEFIFQIYSIGEDGINIEKFKHILFSNWYYYTYKSSIKWSKFLGTFNQIQIYFKDIDKIEDWIIQIKKIMKIKNNISDKSEYLFHPIYNVSVEDLKNLLSIMEEIKYLTQILSHEYKNFSQHIEFLKNKIIYSNKILLISDDELTEAQKLIKKFYNMINKITSDSTIQNLDSYFFMKHIKNILLSFDETDKEKNKIKINIQNMLNLKHYKYVIFMGLENNNYPREHNPKFPFTPEIIEIIRNLGVHSYVIDIYENNLLMENLFFKNVIDFTDKEIWFTYTKFNKRIKNKISIYAEEISTLFDSNINFYSLPKFKGKNSEIKINKNFCPPIYLKPKEEYTLKELVTFQLCPKLYYHKYTSPVFLSYATEKQLRLYAESILYCDLLNKFGEYNLKSRKWYSASNKEVNIILESLLEISFKQLIQTFSFLGLAKLKHIKEKCLNHIINFIENYVIDTLEYYKYTLVKSNGQIYRTKDFSLKLDYDTEIYCKNNKNSKIVYQNNIYLDFLTFKCTQKEIHEKHYKDMLFKLQEKDRYIDRIFLANRILSKINIQFANGNEYYIKGNDGGIERVSYLKNEILTNNILQISSCQSNFCEYCIVRNICVGGKQMSKFLEVIE